MFHGKTIVLGVSGGIAAYKAADLCSKLIRLGAEVHVMMTDSAVKFISPLTFQALSKQPVKVDTFDEQDASVIAHIDLADRADVVVIAPATANLIGKMAHGLADDMLSTTLLAATSPVLVAPAMNVHMYDHPAVRHNMKLLEERGVRFIDPGVGQLACGYVGKGRMAEPEDIVEAIRSMLEPNLPLSGKKVLVTAGSTQERIDPVRYIGNDASGKTGFAIAQAARDLGAEVVLVSGPSTAEPPAGMKLIRVMSAQDMFDAVLAEFADSDIIIKSAAVADYRPVETAKQKIKKQGDTLTLTLVKNPDILQTLGERKTNQFLVGFAAETDHIEQYAMEKLHRKNCDLVVANDVSEEGAGFYVDTNIIHIFDKDGKSLSLPKMSKKHVAEQLWRFIIQRLKDEGRL